MFACTFYQSVFLFFVLVYGIVYHTFLLLLFQLIFYVCLFLYCFGCSCREHLSPLLGFINLFLTFLLTLCCLSYPLGKIIKKEWHKQIGSFSLSNEKLEVGCPGLVGGFTVPSGTHTHVSFCLVIHSRCLVTFGPRMAFRWHSGLSSNFYLFWHHPRLCLF